MDGRDFVTVGEFERTVSRLEASDVRIQKLHEQTSENLQQISKALAVHLSQQEVADAQDKTDRQRIFAVTLVVLTASLAAIMPWLLRSLDLVSGVV
jgi:hypothetical protein